MILTDNLCPICKSKMRIEDKIWRYCEESSDHGIAINTMHDRQTIYGLYVEPFIWNKTNVWNGNWFEWEFNGEETKLMLYRKDKDKIELPFFEPDFSDYDKLLQRLKTCLIFS